LLHLVTPLLILLSGPQNAFVFFIFNVQLKLLLLWQEYLFDISPAPAWLLSIIIAGLSHAAFFITGHTNSIASVDLSNAYIGVQEYNTVLIGLLTFCSNWSASTWWSIAGWALVENVHKQVEEEEGRIQPWFTFIIAQSALFSLVLSLLSISVTILREHLFIWTVFSPKYLYQIAWTVLFHWMVQVVIGSFFTQVLFKWNFSNNTDVMNVDHEGDLVEEDEELLDDEEEETESDNGITN
jgi:ethanolaminephosphotransferase